MYTYETTQRRYTCEICTKVDDDYQIQNEVMLKEESKDETDQTKQAVTHNTIENKDYELKQKTKPTTEKELNEINGTDEHSIITETVQENQITLHNTVKVKEDEVKLKTIQYTNEKDKTQSEPRFEHKMDIVNVEQIKE